MDSGSGADRSTMASAAGSNPNQNPQRPIQQPTPQKIQQPTPQRLDKAPPSASGGARIVQPTPQVLPQKPSSGSTILVSPRQRGNPVLTHFKAIPWEYSDIPADYVMGITTCALFLSLKYHRLHPEYIYTRIRNLQGRYNLRIILTMVDIPNHEDPLRELSKTSLVNNVTVILCWSASEAAHYLELYKSNENAPFTSIKGQQATNYADRLVDFVTTPRSLNKSDAVALVANFGSLRNALNADAEALGMIGGWGGVKVKRWLHAMEEPFRVRKAAKRGLGRQESSMDGGSDPRDRLSKVVPLSRVPLREMSSMGATASAGASPGPVDQREKPKQFALPNDDDLDEDEDEEEALMAVAMEESLRTSQSKAPPGSSSSAAAAPAPAPAPDTGDDLSTGVAAALAKLREKG